MATATKVPIPRHGVDYRGKIVLAPMVRSGECPSRLLSLKYGADLVWGPETIDKAIIGCTRQINPRTGTIDFVRLSGQHIHQPSGDKENIIFRLHPELEGKRLIYQMGSADPELAVAAGKAVAADVAGIDLNSGCPKPFSTLGGMGAALLKTPDKLCAILTALVKEVGEPFEIGISVKIRLLETAELTRALVTRLVKTGITGLTIHCRTTPMRPREPAIREQLHMIGQICKDAGVACLMNGDVTSRAEAVQLAEQFEVDGAMIATAAEANPSVFRSKEDGGKADWPAVVKEYVGFCMQIENKWSNTKYLLCQMVPGKTPVYKSLINTKCYSDLVQPFDWPEYADRARAADRALELGEFAPVKLTKAEKKKLAKETVKSEITDTQPTSRKRTADQAALDESDTRTAPTLLATLSTPSQASMTV